MLLGSLQVYHHRAQFVQCVARMLPARYILTIRRTGILTTINIPTILSIKSKRPTVPERHADYGNGTIQRTYAQHE
ncbi:MAG: hypothetical protein HC911_15215 [Chloroflexaceae bacterium]|nr:hypothetical protein [Chloroflexaceae bacterium]